MGIAKIAFDPLSPLPLSNGYVGAPFRTLFFLFLWTPWHQKWDHRVCILQTMSICNGYWILHSQASGRSVWSSLHIIPDVLAKTQRWVGCSKFGSKFFFLTGDALWPKITDNFLDILTLEGAGHQIVDTRPIFGLLLTNLGYNGSN